MEQSSSLVRGGLYMVQSRGGAPVAVFADETTSEFFTLVSDDVPIFRSHARHNGLKLETDFVADEHKGTITVLGQLGCLLPGIEICKRSELLIVELLCINASHAVSETEQSFYTGILQGIVDGDVVVEPGYIRLPLSSAV